MRSTLARLALVASLLLLTGPLARPDVRIASFVDGAISNTAPISSGETFRVDFYAISGLERGGAPSIGSYDLLLRWNTKDFELQGIEFSDRLGSEARGESTTDVEVMLGFLQPSEPEDDAGE